MTVWFGESVGKSIGQYRRDQELESCSIMNCFRFLSLPNSTVKVCDKEDISSAVHIFHPFIYDTHNYDARNTEIIGPLYLTKMPNVINKNICRHDKSSVTFLFSQAFMYNKVLSAEGVFDKLVL